MGKRKTDEEKQQEAEEMQKFLDAFPAWAAEQYDKAESQK